MELTLSPEELAFYKRYGLPIPKTPTMRAPLDLEQDLLGRAAKGDKSVALKKNGQLSKTGSAFDEILELSLQGQATGVPKAVPGSTDIDTGKNFQLPKGEGKAEKRRLLKALIESPEPVLKTQDGQYKFPQGLTRVNTKKQVVPIEADSNDVRELSDPVYTSTAFDDIMKRVTKEHEGDGPEPIDVPGLDDDFYKTFFATEEERADPSAPVEKGNIDLTNRPVVQNDDGSISTVRSMSFEEDGKEVLVPTITDDGRNLSNEAAIAQYRRTGKHLGKFKSVDAANQYAQTLHEEQDAMYSNQPTEEPVEGEPVSAFDQFLKLIEPNPNRKVDADGLTEQNRAFREDTKNIGAGILAAPGETLYGLTGFGLKGAETIASEVAGNDPRLLIEDMPLPIIMKPAQRAAKYVNDQIFGPTPFIPNSEKPQFNFGSKGQFAMAEGATRSAEWLTGAKPVASTRDNFFRNLGAAALFLPIGGPLVAVGDTLVGTTVGDVLYDLTDPKYKSITEVWMRQPSNKKPELQPFAEVGMVEGDEEISSFYKEHGNWPWLVLAAAATAGGARQIRKYFRPTPPLSVKIDPALQPPPAGKVPTGWEPENPLVSLTTPGTAVRTAHQDANQIIKEYSRMANGGREDDAQHLAFVDQLETQSHVAGQETASASVRTGRMITPTRILEGPSPYVLREAHRKMKPEQQAIFNDGMLAADKIDDLNNGKSAQVVGMTMADAQKKVNLMRQDPMLVELETAYRKVTNNILELETDTGLIDPIFRTQLSTARPGFMPNIRVDDQIDKAVWEQFKDAIIRDPGEPDDGFRMLATIHRRDEDVGGRNFLPPMDALMAYVQHSIQFANHNRLRRKLLTDLMHNPDKKISATIRQIIPNSNSNIPVNEAATVGYHSNGEKIKFELGDPQLARALQFSPNIALFPMMNGFRKYSQFFITGMNPYFAPVAFLREANQSSVFRPPGRTFGPADQLMQYATGGRMGVRGDLTGFVNAFASLSGIPRDLGPKAALALSEHIHSTLMAGNKPFWGALDQMFGAGSTKAVADRMRNAYMVSMRGVLDHMGGYNVKQTHYSLNQASNALDKASQAWVQRYGESSLGVWNGYKASIESLHNASRLYFFAQNYKSGMSVPEIRRLARETQNLTGDLRKVGLGTSASKIKAADSNNEAIRRGMANIVNGTRIPRAAIESSLYANPTVQGLAKVGETLRTDATGFGMGLFNTIAAPTVASLTMAAYLDYNDPDGGYLDYYFNRRPEWEKVNSIPVFLPGVPPEDSPKILIDPTIGMFAYGTASVLDQIVSARDWNPELNQMGLAVPAPSQMVRRGGMTEAGRHVWSAIGSSVGMNMPVPMSVYLAMNDYDTFNTSGPGYGGIYKKKTEDLSGSGEFTGLQEPDNVLPMWGQNMINEVHGSVGSFFTSILDAGVAGYDEGGVRTAMEAIGIQSEMEMIKGFKFAAPITGYHQEYASYESDIKYEKQRAANNLAEVISAQLSKGGVDINQRTPKGVEGIISDDAMKGLNVYGAQAGRRLQPIKNQKFLQVAPLIYEYVKQDDHGILTLIKALSVVGKQQKDLKSINAGNMHLFPDAVTGKKGGITSLMYVQKRINELELIKRKLNIRYIETMKALEEQIGMNLEDIDPMADVKLDPAQPPVQQPQGQPLPEGEGAAAQ